MDSDSKGLIFRRRGACPCSTLLYGTRYDTIDARYDVRLASVLYGRQEAKFLCMAQAAQNGSSGDAPVQVRDVFTFKENYVSLVHQPPSYYCTCHRVKVEIQN